MRGKAIWAAYTQTNALAVPCGYCSAPAGTWCSLPDGRVRRVPCVSRCGEGDPLRTALSGRDAPIDFSEPRYTSEES